MFFFVLFCLNVKDKKKILAKKLREDKLKKLTEGFLEYKYILIFDKLFWFAYKSLDKLKEVAK